MKNWASLLAYAPDAPSGSGMVERSYGLYKTTPSTLADGEYDALRLRKDGALVVGSHSFGSWSAVHTPAANTQATISKAAGGASVRHVCKGFCVSLSSGAGAPTPELITWAIRDGATGAGTIIFQGTLSLPATAGTSTSFGLTGLYLVGTADTAMTIETDSAPGANVVASVSIFGESIPA